MYQPEKYQKNTLDFVKALIREYPFAEIILQGEELLATHIPILIDEEADEFRLYAHIADHNPMKMHLRDGKEALLIFKGADAYVSSSWYMDKDISTWDYSAVHINCKLKIQSKDELIKSLKLLVHHFEQKQSNPLEYKDLPREIIESHLPRITGFWCEPFKIEGIGKWHQGFGKKDVENIISHLGTDKECPANKRIISRLKDEHDL